jgi:hypothetical protein
MINVMAGNSEDCNIKNHISSLDCQFLAEDQSDIRISGKVRWGTSPLVEINQQMETDNYSNFTKERYFLICESCFWCASYFKNQTTFLKCPLCYKGKIECMPIGEAEYCRFDYSHTKGVELTFSNNIRC